MLMDEEKSLIQQKQKLFIVNDWIHNFANMKLSLQDDNRKCYVLLHF